ncbi:ATP-binding cassette domain-containing protein [Rathayibacter toxicus]|uniref:ABC transporter domain-containing protein n=1 Tax=Rathayibacter toxicus TaxID=145458 RepID=A0A0C5BSA4_9MICO|nr:ABC transporter ATP-binding protein [Rathayibacter toxicus]AJM77532.1 hypothetical protein TI83_05435 [Rathayibacter toxicus]ALS56548.1 hypothetical protein APU90_01040 [Rathayibacter toxicus]KKM44645.1 hypothetical protein VT73_09005 [Rathayibacter toxicus]QOD07516.1 ABC transporter ATP-binding protein [Rathayibacter toxicus]QOD09618.1 ABC transporter ATP-binding protein [Rathayibacter toxicus]
MAQEIIFESVTKRFGDTTVFSGNNFELKDGLTFLVGRNGAGKSTFARLATGIERPTSGTVTLFGDPTHSISLRTKHRLGVQLQNDAFLKGVRVGEYISLYEKIFAAGETATLTTQESVSTAEIIDMLDIEPLLRSYAYALSGGQKKRISLLLAIIGKKQLLILDEPTAGIDVDVKDKIMRVIRHVKSCGVNLVVSSHDLTEFFDIADNVLVVERGIRFHGTKATCEEKYGFNYKVTLTSPRDSVALPSVRHEDGTSYYAYSADELATIFPDCLVEPTATKDLYQLATRANGLDDE